MFRESMLKYFGECKYMEMEERDQYQGYEQGPIRPPSEDLSLLIRVTRNCPWNRCSFCPVYKGTHFSVRPIEHVLKDIDQIVRAILLIQSILEEDDDFLDPELAKLNRYLKRNKIDKQAFFDALFWCSSGMRSIFLQDANSLVLPTKKLLIILNYLKDFFPFVERITSYARSQTIYTKSLFELVQLRNAGLNRLHIGLESGSDTVLKFMHKGVTKQQHIEAGKKVMEAGIELSEYYIPGLGGREHWLEHAIESADALNRINPTFIRIRTLAIPPNTPLFDDWKSERFQKCTDEEIVQELLCFIQHLDGITSTIKSDHILNLLPEIEGKLPEDKPKMISIINEFLSLSPEEKLIYQVGRRMGTFQSLSELNSGLKLFVKNNIERHNITLSNVEDFINQVMSRKL